ncbi:MAG TPA: S53 family peptidase [Ktedonobacteraceae bacterium]|nr:S53 family peptidase [Ktedonobacteraceae bacterium]
MRVKSIHPRIVVPLLSVMLIVALFLLVISPFTHAQPANPRVTLSDSASAFTSKSQLVANTPANQTISLAVGLSLRNTASLATYLREITDPNSLLYRHYLNPATFAALYGPLPQSEADVSAFLRSQGFTITATYPNHLMVDAVGTVAQAQHAFQVQINNYRSATGQPFYANANPPSLPVQLAPLVATISGLDNAIQYHRNPLANGKATIRLGPSSTASPTSTSSSVSCPKPGSTMVPTSYTPSQVATAYDFTKLYNAGYMGEGQTVGLLELDGFSASDIAAYTACFGGHQTLIKTIPIDGYNGAAGTNAAEVELDMEMILGLAPHLASLRVYEASATSLAAYNDAWARIVSDVTPVVSTSWVFCEQGSGMTNEIQQENIFFQAAAAQGQTILAASGDLGANGCYNPQTGANTTPAVDDPASQPYVTGVGGTTLHVNFDNTYQFEQVWNDRNIHNGASGGGISLVWRMPYWQQAPGVANAYSTGFREVPDVSLNADPQTGYDVYCTAGGCAKKGWMIFGGTSAAAPAWAAMMALANQVSIKANAFMVGFLNPSLYNIAHGTVGTSYNASFHDIVPVTGYVNNNDYVGSSGTYPDGSAYDLATGLGTYDAYNLSQNLLTLGQAVPHQSAPTSTTWYFAEGRVGLDSNGNDFEEYLTLENPDPVQTAQVKVQYLFENGTGPAVMHSVPPQSRYTVSVNADVHVPFNSKSVQPHSLSMIVTSTNGVGIVAERPLYFNFHGISSGTDVLGATKLGTDFYFADIESQRNYSSFVTILNPPGGSTAHVTVTYYAGGAILATDSIVVPPGQRGTTYPQKTGVNINTKCAFTVHSDQPVAVERPTYFTTSRSNISGAVTGASSVIGARAPGKDWLFAEGYTGYDFHEYLVLANFDSTATANATINLEYSNGAVNPQTVQVPPMSQVFFDVNAASDPNVFAQATTEVSAEVTSDSPIVAERQEYFLYNSTIPGGTDVIGEPGPAKVVYSFAEGYTTSGFNEFLTLQNPNTSSESVAVTLYLHNSIISQQVVTVGPQTRYTMNINSLVVPIAQANTGAGYEVSLAVWAASGTIVVERPMYFNFHGFAKGGTDVIGYSG